MTLPIMPSPALVGKRACAHTHTHYRYLAHFWKSFPSLKQNINTLRHSDKFTQVRFRTHIIHSGYAAALLLAGVRATNVGIVAGAVSGVGIFFGLVPLLNTMSTTSHLKCQSGLIEYRLAGWKLLRIGVAELALLWLRLGFFAAASFSTATSAVFVLFF